MAANGNRTHANANQCRTVESRLWHSLMKDGYRILSNRSIVFIQPRKCNANLYNLLRNFNFYLKIQWLP